MGKFPYDKDMTGIAQTLRHQATPEESSCGISFSVIIPCNFAGRSHSVASF